jgi:hypothetical protein
MKFVGGESAALGRVNEYFWKKASENVSKLWPCYSKIFSLFILFAVPIKKNIYFLFSKPNAHFSQNINK